MNYMVHLKEGSHTNEIDYLSVNIKEVHKVVQDEKIVMFLDTVGNILGWFNLELIIGFHAYVDGEERYITDFESLKEAKERLNKGYTS